MSEKAPMAKKLTIEIENIADRRECITAIRELFGALKDGHGPDEAFRLWRYYNEAPPADRRERSRLRLACMSFGYDDLRLILEFFAMPKPNKEKLARDLAKKNENLPERERYPVKSAEDPAAAILQQIKRAFRFDREACRIIGEAPEYLRQEKLDEIIALRRSVADLKFPIKLPRMRYITIHQRFDDNPKYQWIFDRTAPGGTK
jgi:hypothetical protein